MEILVFLLAGIGAGIVTGLVGASAIMVAAPLLIVFLNYPAYLAIGISLLIDVFASSSAALVYHKHGQLKIKPSLVLLFSALFAVIAASYFSKSIPSGHLGFLTGIGIILGGISIMVKKDRAGTKKDLFLEKYKTPSLILIGLLIGTVSGIFGAGGGIMILLTLIVILNYNTHKAIGTSVFLMIFIALFGGISHYVNMPFSMTALILGGAGGIIGAFVASKFANKLDEKRLNLYVGFIVTGLGILLLLNNIFG
ncbi:MAG: sulfite exporter TauE/SafE family protein [Nanoarchaeota archaeon]|jgi:uncharacterized membrane protein YfcA|nr:sulfite exporter TauE/SafE family protein [Nanoarchaeota archaeon]